MIYECKYCHDAKEGCTECETFYCRGCKKRVSWSKGAEDKLRHYCDDCVAKMPKKPYYKLSPELVDGDHWTVTAHINDVVEAVRLWCKETDGWPGSSCKVEIIEMTEAEYDSLKEI